MYTSKFNTTRAALLEFDYFYYYLVWMVHEFNLAELAVCETVPGHGFDISIGQVLFPVGSSDFTLLDGQRT